MAYKDDCGKLRKAMARAGIDTRVTTIFDDIVPGACKRKLELWFAQNVWDAPAKQQWALHDNLHKQFGKRILAMYFIRPTPGSHVSNVLFVIELCN